MIFLGGQKMAIFAIFHLIFGCFCFWGPYNALLTGPGAWEWRGGIMSEICTNKIDAWRSEADFRTQPHATTRPIFWPFSDPKKKTHFLNFDRNPVIFDFRPE